MDIGYSPEFPRRGHAALFGVRVTRATRQRSLGLTIQHRDAQDEPWTELGSFPELTGPCEVTMNCEGCKETLRYKYVLAGSESGRIEFQLQEPDWRPR